MASNLVTVQSINTKRGSAYYTTSSFTTSELNKKVNYPKDDYSDYEDGYSSNDDDETPIAPVYAAEHTSKDTKQQRRQVMDRVYLPPSRKFKCAADKEVKLILKPARNEVVLTENMHPHCKRGPMSDQQRQEPVGKPSVPNMTDPRDFHLHTTENLKGKHP